MLSASTSVIAQTNLLYMRGVEGVEKYPMWQKYQKWLNEAKPGERFTYYIGLTPGESYQGSKLAHAIYRDATQGLVLLFRRKTASHVFEYLAQKTSDKPPQKLIPLIHQRG